MGNKAKLVLTGSICLTDIPKELIKCPSNCKKYLNIAVLELAEPSKFGDTHIITCAPKKEERAEGKNYIIGNFKTWVDTFKRVSAEEIENAPGLKDDEDYPF